MRRIFRRTLKVLLYFGVIVVVLVVGFAALTQTQFFRDRLRVLVAAALSEQLNGHLVIGTIGGDFLNGFTIDSLSVFYGDDPVVRTGKISFTYNVLPFLERKILVRSCIVEEPLIEIRRTAAGEWNVAKIFKPAADTANAEFTGYARIDNLEIKNATVIVLDSAALLAGKVPDGKHIDYGNLTVTGLFLRANALVNHGTVEAAIQHASLNLRDPVFHLTQMKGTLRLDPKGVRADNWIVQTGNSYIEWDASLRAPAILRNFSLARLQHDSTALNLRARNVDFDELKMFLAPLDFLNGSSSIDLRCGGTFGDLDVYRLDLGFAQSALHISGAVRNLHDPQRLALATYIGESRIAPRDIARLLPEFGIPAFDSVGTTYASAEFNGTPLTFKAKVLLRGKGWTCNADGSMNLAERPARYDVAFRTSSVDLKRFFNQASLSSSLTAHGTARGAGFTPDDAATTLAVTVDSSRFRNLPVEHGELSATLANRRLEGSSQLRSGPRRADVTLHLDYSTPSAPLFTSDVSLGSFDLAELFGEDYTSDLTLNAHCEGSGSTIDNLNTQANVSLFPSAFRNQKFDGEEWSLTLDQRDPDQKQLALSSPLADVTLDGRFDLDYAAETIAGRFSNLVKAIHDHAMPPDSVKPTRSSPPDYGHSASARTMQFDYHCILKKLSPVADLFRTQRFDGRGDLSGTIRSTPDELSLTCNGTLAEFYLGSSEKGFLLNDCKLNLSIDSLQTDDPLEHLAATLAMESGGAVVNTTRIGSLSTGLTYHNTRGSVRLAGIADTLYGFTLKGETSIQPGTYVFDLDTLHLDIGPYEWRNKQDVQFRLNNDGTRIMHAEMIHNDASVSGAGILHYDGEIEGEAKLRNYDLAELNLWLPRSRFQSATRHFSGASDADIDVRGSMENPIFNIMLSANRVSYRQSAIGRVNAQLRYADTLAHVDIAIRGEGEDSLSSLTLRGTLPINLGFAGVEERFPDKQQSLVLSSSQFDLAILDPFIAELDDLTGKCTADITVQGTPQEPEYSGVINIHSSRFIFTPNNVVYFLDGDFHPSGDKIVLGNVVLKNQPIDGKQGTANLRGTITITDYAIARFDITASGSIFLMSDASRQTIGTIYGPLLAETDQDGMTLKGSFSQPEVSGKLFVRDANLTFPPAREFATTSTQIALHHVVVDDTTQRRKIPQRQTAYFAGENRRVAASATPDQSPTFIENLRYNLTVETRGTTAIRMIFTPATNEELYAELEGRVNVVSVQGTPSAYGEISVLPHSYYNFFKRFDATGSLKFVGPWDNPELNIKATYEGYHVDDSLARAGLNGQQRVTVTLDITGKRYEPKLGMSMSIQQQPGEPATDWSTLGKGGDVQSDAISFILTGRFRDEMTSSDRRYLTTNVGSTASSGFTSTLLSGILTNFLRSEFPGIRNAEITYQGGNPDVRITADVLKGYLQFGGKILNNISNANVSYQVNLGEFFNKPSIRNLFLEIQHRDSDLTEERKTDEARIYYRFSF